MTTEEKYLIDDYVKLVACGDKVALAKLYESMYKPLYYILIKHYKNHHEIEDVIDEIFEVIIKKSKKLLFYKNCYKWIIRIVVNKLRNRLKKQYRRNELMKCIPFATHIRFNESKAHLLLELQNLPHYDQYLIFYKFYCRFKIDEIAIIMNKSRATINREIKLILEYLREKLK